MAEPESGARPAIAIVGPGAVGTVIAAALHEAGQTPMLCGALPRHESAMFDGTRRVLVPRPVRTDPHEATGPVDLVFLAVKATQVESAAPWLEALCGVDTVVCALQNGVDQVGLVAPHVPGCPVVPAIVWFPAEAEPDGMVRLRGEPRLTVPDSADAGAVSAAFEDTWLTVDAAPDYLSLAWHKLLRSAVGGLMALTGRRAGMYRRPDVAALSLAYLRECVAVATAEGAVLDLDCPEGILASLQAYSADVPAAILVDRAAGRRLEWEVCNAVVQTRGRRHQIATPISDIVVPLLAAASDGPG